jgi:hypothetical protein
MFAKPEPRRACRKQRFQTFLAFDERKGSGAFAIQEEKVEGEEDEIAGATVVHRGLQSAERCHPIGANCGQLAVHICALHVEDAKRGDGRLIAVAPVEPGAGQQSDVAAIDAGMHAIAIVLDLVDPAGTVRRFVHESRQLRLDPSWRMVVRRFARSLWMARHSALLGPRWRIRPIERL